MTFEHDANTTFGEWADANDVPKSISGQWHRHPDENYDVVGNIMAYEQGELDDENIVILFQYLVDSGQAWQLQGAYSRMACYLIEEGLVTDNNA